MRNRFVANARKRRPKTKAKVSALRIDPTRSLALRRQMAVRVKNMFAKLRIELYRLIVDEDEFGLKNRHLIRNNCGIGPDGFEAGNDCAADGGSGGTTGHMGEDITGAGIRKYELRSGSTKIGDVKVYDKGGGTVRTEQLGIKHEYRGKGHAKTMYQNLFKDLKKEGVKTVISGGNQSPGGRAVWESLRKSGLPIKDVAGEHGKPSSYKIDLDDLTDNVTTNADAWRFHSDPEKLKAFQKWLRRQLAMFLIGRTQEELWRVYVEQGVKKGAARSFEDARGIEKLKDAGVALAFYAGTKEEFLRSSFRQPESVDKIKLLASRTFTDLKNVTEDMATRMGRTLVDGLTAGQGPRQIARALDKDLDIGRTRALTIARTEIIRAHAEGQLLALEQLGVQEVGAMVEWSTAGDERVCQLCKPLEGVVLKLDEAKGMLPRHPNCRCAWIPANVGEDQSKSKTTKGQITKSVTKSQELEGKDTSWGPGKAIAKNRPESILNAAIRFNKELSRLTKE